LGLQGLWGGVLSITTEEAARPALDFGLQGVSMKIAVGKAQIEFLESGGFFTDKPMNPHEGYEKDKEQTGNVSKFRVTTSDELDMVFGLVTWPHATVEVRHIETIDGLEKYKRLEQAGRMGVGVYKDNLWYAELRAMKKSKKDRATLNQVSLAELSEMLEGDAKKLLSDSGVVQIGSKAELAGDTSKRKNYLSFMCEVDNEKAIAVAFTLSRVLPIMYDFGLTEEGS
jgi:hypothetical protein